MPTNTDLVTDLPADFEVFGQAVDTSMADLKGGTTGQILSKATNTDMDFTWITNDVGDITAVTATSPLTGGGTSGAITVGIQDATTSVKGSVQLSDSTSTTSSVLAATPTAVKSAYDLAAAAVPSTTNFFAGKNKVINGDFGIWQRGTTFTVTGTENSVFKADRWCVQADGSTTTRTISQQTFTAGTAPVAGYEGTYFFRYAQTAAGNNTYNYLSTRLEDVRLYAGQTVTLSFWGKADSARTVQTYLSQNFGTGGSSAVNSSSQNNSFTTSWQRFTYTVALPSIAGKTIGTGSFLEPTFQLPSGAITPTIDLWGVQLEAASTASNFQTATGTKQGELAACQRYYAKSYNTDVTVPTNGTTTGIVFAYSTATLSGAKYLSVTFKSEMRTTPTITIYSFTTSQTGRVSDADGTDLAANSGTATHIGTRGFTAYNNSGGVITPASGGFIFHYAASAEL